jgi:hypothetical protein
MVQIWETLSHRTLSSKMLAVHFLDLSNLEHETDRWRPYMMKLLTASFFSFWDMMYPRGYI